MLSHNATNLSAIELYIFTNHNYIEKVNRWLREFKIGNKERIDRIKIKATFILDEKDIEKIKENGQKKGISKIPLIEYFSLKNRSLKDVSRTKGKKERRRYGISVLFNRRITYPVISMFDLPIVNIHPAPLPEYKGVGWDVLAYSSNRSNWEITAHTIDNEEFDVGKVIRTLIFPLSNKARESIEGVKEELEEKIKYMFFYLLNTYISDEIKALINNPIRIIASNEGTYYSRKEIERIKEKIKINKRKS